MLLSQFFPPSCPLLPRLCVHNSILYVCIFVICSGCCCSVAKSCLTLRHPMDWNVLGSSVFQFLPEFGQIHVHWVTDSMEPSHSLLPLSPFAFSLFPASGSFQVSQLFISGGHSIGASASVLLMNIQGWFPLGLTSLIFLQSKGLSRVFSSTTI